MKVRELKWDKEIIFLEEGGGEEIRCPVCGAMWMRVNEHAESFCPHFRFVYCISSGDSGDFMYFSGRWAKRKFERQFYELTGAEDGLDIERAFRKLNPPGVDEVVYYTWADFPMAEASAYWGFEKDSQKTQHRAKVAPKRRKRNRS